jgi:DNA transposition AAA+ family ATPase
MHNRIVPLDQLTMLANTVAVLASDPADSGAARPAPGGVVLVTGPAGAGKSWALQHAARHSAATCVIAMPFWTPHGMLSTITRRFDLAPRVRVSALFDQLADSPAVRHGLLIDEADQLVDRPILLETLRILHDVSGGPLVLAGSNPIRRAVARSPQLSRRVVQSVELEPLKADDARAIATARVSIPLAPDLIDELCRRAGGNPGLFCHALGAAERYARRRAAGDSEPAPLTLDDYRDRLGAPGKRAVPSPATARTAGELKRRVA